MKISDLLQVQSIALGRSLQDKTDAINQLVELMSQTGALSDAEKYKQGVFKREEESTTGIGEGIAIPHCKSSAVIRPQIVAMVAPDGVDYQSLDGEPAKLFFLIAAPNSEENVHLDVLAKLSAMLMDFEFTEKLIAAQSAEEFLALLEEKAGEKKEPVSTDTQKECKILAVTSCPTGIAHTYMAAEGLELAAKRLGVAIKVETRGSGGAKNALTAEEIANADCIIVTADATVPMARFKGKKVIQTKFADGIHKADELIQRALSGNVAVYQTSGADSADDGNKEKLSFGRQLYKHLMSGVSHMLPFIIGGGILKAIAFLCDMGQQNVSNLGNITKAAQLFSTIGDAAFAMFLPIFAMYIAYSIADRPGLVVGFAGGMLASNAKFNIASLFFNVQMNAAPGFIGAIFAGFAGGYLVLLLRKITEKIPNNLDGIRSTFIYPLGGVLGIGIVMFLFNVPFSYIGEGLEWTFNKLAESSATNLWLAAVAGFIFGAMMSIDFGGPINKAAYVTGTAAIATALANGSTIGSNVMAAVMIGGMIPPLAIALSTTITPNRWTKKQRSDGLVNYLMGLAFITEGAIPYAAQDPKRVIPACAVGAGVAGMMSMLFGCASPAPHGGIFVIPVVHNWYWYLLSIAVGTVVGGVLLSFLRKPLPAEESGLNAKKNKAK